MSESLQVVCIVLTGIILRTECSSVAKSAGNSNGMVGQLNGNNAFCDGYVKLFGSAFCKPDQDGQLNCEEKCREFNPRTNDPEYGDVKFVASSCFSRTDQAAMAQCHCFFGYCYDGTCGDHGSCDVSESTDICSCNDGYEGNYCDQDINECTTGAANCHSDATCTNTAGSFTCVCDDGYTGDGASCTDVDECATGEIGYNRCRQQHRTCKNDPGTFECTTCIDGYEEINEICEDIDECKDSDTVSDCNDDMGKVCENTFGSFNCVCPEHDPPFHEEDGVCRTEDPSPDSQVWRLEKLLDGFVRIVSKDEPDLVVQNMGWNTHVQMIEPLDPAPDNQSWEIVDMAGWIRIKGSFKNSC